MPVCASIFLSYSREDSAFVLHFAAALRNSGVQVFLDQLDIRTGDDWRGTLEKALNDSAGVIAVLSPNSVKSEYCRREWHRADDLKVPIYPVLLESVPTTDWPLVLQSKQFVDFVRWQSSGVFSAQLVPLIAAIRREIPEQVRPAPGLEEQYLNSLVADMERRRGVLQFVPLDVTASIRPSAPEDEWGFSLLLNPRQQHPRSAEADVLGFADVLSAYSQFVIAGQPGSGKSTILRRLARDAAQKRLANKAEPIPLILPLPEWNADSDFTTFLQRHVQARGWPGSIADVVDNSWILLDGLNELGVKGLEVAQALREWLKGIRSSTRVVVACRQADYDSLELNLPVVLIRELSIPQATTFATSYLGKSADAFMSRIFSRSDSHRELSRLAKNPYLLSAMIYLQEHSNAELPRNAGVLFDRLTRALWERERQRRSAEWEPFDAIAGPLGKLAVDIIDENLATSISADYAQTRLRDTARLEAACDANFLTRNGESITFYHQLMQEYFAAKHLGMEKVLSRIAAPKYPARRIGRNATPWDHVTVAALGLAEQRVQAIERVIGKDPYLVGLWASSADDLSGKERTVVLDGLANQLLKHPDWEWRAAAAFGFGAWGDRAGVAPLSRALNDEFCRTDGGGYEWKIIYPVRTAAAMALGWIGHADATGALIAAARNKDNNWATPNLGNVNACGAALRALVSIGTDPAEKEVRAWIARGEHPELMIWFSKTFQLEEWVRLFGQISLENEKETGFKPRSEEELRGDYDNQDVAYVLALLNSSVIGSGGIRQVATGSWNVDALYVRPQYRKLGIGRLIVEKLFEEARVRAASSVSAELDVSMQAAISLLRGLGFILETRSYSTVGMRIEF